MRTILTEVADYYGLTLDQIQSKSREHRFSHARQAFFYAARQVTWADGTPRYSLPQIAGNFGGMHHTTVMHGIRRHEARLEALVHSQIKCVGKSERRAVKSPEPVHG